jgi:hypothetical protein
MQGWAGLSEANGLILNNPSQKVGIGRIVAGRNALTDDPFAESKEAIAGFFIVMIKFRVVDHASGGRGNPYKIIQYGFDPVIRKPCCDRHCNPNCPTPYHVWKFHPF